MDCKICGEKFTKLKDLVRHGISGRHRSTQFSCLPCAQAFSSVTDVVEHIGTDEHSVMTLATGIPFDAENKPPTTPDPSFPPHSCCHLCSYRGFLPIEEHVQSYNHKYLAFIIKTVIRKKELLCSVTQTNYNTQVLISALINVQQKGHGRAYNKHVHKVTHGTLPFVCELCNIHFREPVYYTRHMENQCHRRMDLFLNKLFHILEEVNVVNAGSCGSVSRTFSNSLEALYHCELCSLWLTTRFKYADHISSHRHKETESLIERKRIEGIALRRVTEYSKLACRCKRQKRLQIEKRANAKVLNGEKQTKFMKMSPSSSNSHGKEESLIKTDGAVSTIQTPSGVEARETKSNSSLDGFGTDDTDSSDDSEIEVVSHPEKHYCELCDFLTYSSLNYEKHLTSKHHRRMKNISDKKQETNSTVKQAEEPTNK